MPFCRQTNDVKERALTSTSVLTDQELANGRSGSAGPAHRSQLSTPPAVLTVDVHSWHFDVCYGIIASMSGSVRLVPSLRLGNL